MSMYLCLHPWLGRPHDKRYGSGAEPQEPSAEDGLSALCAFRWLYISTCSSKFFCKHTSLRLQQLYLTFKSQAKMMALRAPRSTPAVAQRSCSRVSRRFIPVRAQAEKSALAKVREYMIGFRRETRYLSPMAGTG